MTTTVIGASRVADVTEILEVHGQESARMKLISKVENAGTLSADDYHFMSTQDYAFLVNSGLIVTLTGVVNSEGTVVEVGIPAPTATYSEGPDFFMVVPIQALRTFMPYRDSDVQIVLAIPHPKEYVNYPEEKKVFGEESMALTEFVSTYGSFWNGIHRCPVKPLA